MKTTSGLTVGDWAASLARSRAPTTNASAHARATADMTRTISSGFYQHRRTYNRDMTRRPFHVAALMLALLVAASSARADEDVDNALTNARAKANAGDVVAQF